MARAVSLLPEPPAVFLRLAQVKPQAVPLRLVQVKRLLTAVSVSSLMLAMPVSVQLMKLWRWQRASMDWYGGLSPVW